MAFVLLLSAVSACRSQSLQHQVTNAGCPIVWAPTHPNFDTPSDIPERVRIAQIGMLWELQFGHAIVGLSGVFHGLPEDPEVLARRLAQPTDRANLNWEEAMATGKMTFHAGVWQPGEKSASFLAGTSWWTGPLKSVSWVELTLIRFQNGRDWTPSPSSHCEMVPVETVEARVAKTTREPLSNIDCPIVWKVVHPFHSVADLGKPGADKFQAGFKATATGGGITFVSGVLHRDSSPPDQPVGVFQSDNRTHDTGTWIASFSAPADIQSLEITKIRYKDGSEWTPTSDSHCRLVPEWWIRSLKGDAPLSPFPWPDSHGKMPPPPIASLTLPHFAP